MNVRAELHGTLTLISDCSAEPHGTLTLISELRPEPHDTLTLISVCTCRTTWCTNDN